MGHDGRGNGSMSEPNFVQVSPDGKVRINQDDVCWAAFVKGDDSVEFVQAARAMDVTGSSGIEGVGFITAKIEAGQ